MPTAWSNTNRNQQTSASRHVAPRSSPKPPEIPKSDAVQLLENLLEAFISTKERKKKDPKGGCFCQAQVHSLSTYVPNCQSCGLVLCSVNLPHFLCPYCSTELTDARHSQVLISKLEAEISAQIAKEINEKERAEEEARKNIESFPSLLGVPRGDSPHSTRTSTRTSTPEPSFRETQSRKVISLNSGRGRGGKKVTVSTFISAPPSRNAQVLKTADGKKSGSLEQNDVVRIASNENVGLPDLTNCRRWQDPRVESFIYVPPPKSSDNKTGNTIKRSESKARRKDNGEKGVSVPDVEASASGGR